MKESMQKQTRGRVYFHISTELDFCQGVCYNVEVRCQALRLESKELKTESGLRRACDADSDIESEFDRTKFW